MKQITIVVALTIASSAYAQNAQEKTACKALEPAMTSAGTAFSKMYTAMKSMNYDPIIQNFTGDRKLAVIEMQKKQQAVMAPFEAYLISLEDSAIQMRRCAR